jgi:hypothetical protein
VTDTLNVDGWGRIEAVYYRDGRFAVREVDNPDGWILASRPVDVTS